MRVTPGPARPAARRAPSGVVGGAGNGGTGGGECVLALLGPDGSAEAVLRRARRLADGLGARFVVLNVEGPSAAAEPRLLALAVQLGAELETRVGRSVAASALELVATRGVTQVVIGRPRFPLLRRLAGRDLAVRLLAGAPGVALHIVATGPAPRTPPRRRPLRWLPWVQDTALVLVLVGAGIVLRPVLPYQALGMAFLTAVVVAGALWGSWLAAYAAALGFLCWDLFFIPPLYALGHYRKSDALSVLVFVLAAAFAGWLAGRSRAEARGAHGRIEGLGRIVAFSRRLGVPAEEGELLREIASQAAGTVGGAGVVLLSRGRHLDRAAAVPGRQQLDDTAWSLAERVRAQPDAAEWGLAAGPANGWWFLPMRTGSGEGEGLIGVLGVRAGDALAQAQLQALSALADQAALALDRVRLAREAALTAAQAETEKLRTALLSSIGHDLRTPLTVIRGAADTLRAAWQQLTPATREDLLEEIGEEVERMGHFLANIVEMTRLESGDIVPRREPTSVADTIAAAMARVPNARDVRLDLAPDLPEVLADPTLLEQVLVNALDNATKYSPPGAAVEIGAGAADGQVWIAVADGGIGIPADELPHIFDRFYRGAPRGRPVPGTGLGLAIARGLVEAMGGTIGVASPRPGTSGSAPGTEITLHLPVAAASAAAAK